jgi:6-pyruvoyl-tetrahydropterin synthase
MKTIFVHNATVLDCAVLFPGVGARGQSWHVDIFWSGHVAEDGVLVDFGDAKRLAKQTIDTEFDHRLFVPRGAVIEQTDGRTTLATTWDEPQDCGAFVLDTYNNAIVCVNDDIVSGVFAQNLAPLEMLIAAAVKAASPQNVSEVIVRLRNAEYGKSNFFSYTHSLRCHSGNCQRFHGHSNVIEVLRGGVVDDALSAEAARFLMGKYLVPKSYVKSHPDKDDFSRIHEIMQSMAVLLQGHAFVEYRGSQGVVRLALPEFALIATPEESTIESIADFVKTRLFSHEDVQVIAFEGLQKGAFSS